MIGSFATVRACWRVFKADDADKWTMWVRRDGCFEAQRRIREMAESSSDEGRDDRKVE